MSSRRTLSEDVGIREAVLVGAVTLLLLASLALGSWGDTFGLLALAVAGLVVVARVWNRYPHPVTRIILFALVLRMLAALVQYYVIDLPDSTADARGFERRGWALAQRGLSGFVDAARGGFSAGEGESTYATFIGIVYWLFGVRSPLAIQAINVLFGALAVAQAYRLGLLLWGERAARKLVLFAALFPSLILYSAITLREAPVVFLVALAGVRIAEWAQGVRRRPYAAIVYSFLASVFHIGASAVALGIAAYALTVVVRRSPWFSRRRRLIALVAAASVVAAFATIMILNFGLVKVGGNPFDAAAIGQEQRQRVTGGSVYLRGIAITSWYDVFWQGPLRAFFLLFTPFPWQVRSPAQAIGFVDVAGYWWMAALAWRQRASIWRHETARAVLMAVGFLALVFGMGTGNFGTAVRHRQKFVILIAALAAAAWRGWPRRAAAPVAAATAAAGSAT